jgi:hypothetical protein
MSNARFTMDNGGSAQWDLSRNDPPVEPVSRLRARSQGPRSLSTRTAVIGKFVGYFFAAVLAAALTNALLVAAGTTSYGGTLMWFSTTVMFVTAAIGTVMFPQNRMEILSQMRHYVFGLSLFPGTAIAVVIWALQDVITSPTASSDTLASLINFAVPAVFVTTVILPPIVFVKAVAGYYSLHRSTMSDEETLSIYTRQGPAQR